MEEKDGVTFPAGHFHKHNEDVLKDISEAKTRKEGTKRYIGHLVQDGIALINSGASKAQILASLQAAADQFETKAWPAIVANTSHPSVD